MKLILGKPGTGKTKEILRLSMENNIPVLCESDARVQRLLVKASGYGYSVPTPITVDQITPEIKEVYVDDIERFFSVALGVKASIITVNQDENCEVKDL